MYPLCQVTFVSSGNALPVSETAVQAYSTVPKMMTKTQSWLFVRPIKLPYSNDKLRCSEFQHAVCTSARSLYCVEVITYW